MLPSAKKEDPLQSLALILFCKHAGSQCVQTQSLLTSDRAMNILESYRTVQSMMTSNRGARSGPGYNRHASTGIDRYLIAGKKESEIREIRL
jgi:hypothetical protein